LDDFSSGVTTATAADWLALLPLVSIAFDDCFVTVALVESTEPLEEAEEEAEQKEVEASSIAALLSALDDLDCTTGLLVVVLSWIAVSSSLERSPP